MKVKILQALEALCVCRGKEGKHVFLAIPIGMKLLKQSVGITHRGVSRQQMLLNLSF